MLREILSAFWGRGVLGQVYDDFGRMFDETHWMFTHAVEVFFSRTDWQAIQDTLYARDKEVNRLERAVRAQVVKHLTLRRDTDVPACLVLISVVKDAERIGDYCKNIFEVGKFYEHEFTADRYLGQLEEIRGEVADLFGRCKDAFQQSDGDAARAVIQTVGRLTKACDELIRNLLRERDSLPTDEAVAYSLLARHLKRIAAHLANIVTAVIAPVHRLDFMDEPAPPSEQGDPPKGGEPDAGAAPETPQAPA